jgi:hypothetical protein
VTAIVGWLYEPGMPLALPVMYTDDPEPGVIVQVVRAHNEAQATFIDECWEYKKWLREVSTDANL